MTKSEMFRTVLHPYEHRIEVEKSKFICHLFPVKTPEQAEQAVQSVRKAHYSATHNVPVYIVGDVYKHSDDGEPAGTAAAPVLGMLKNEKYDRICVVVTRYFGGIKLGTGGLVRAYTAAVKEALAHADVSAIERFVRMKIGMEYRFAGTAEYELNRIASEGGALKIAEKTYLDDVTFTVYGAPEIAEKVIEEMRNLTSGSVRISEKDEVWLDKYFELYSAV